MSLPFQLAVIGKPWDSRLTVQCINRASSLWSLSKVWSRSTSPSAPYYQYTGKPGVQEPASAGLQCLCVCAFVREMFCFVLSLAVYEFRFPASSVFGSCPLGLLIRIRPTQKLWLDLENHGAQCCELLGTPPPAVRQAASAVSLGQSRCPSCSFRTVVR